MEARKSLKLQTMLNCHLHFYRGFRKRLIHHLMPVLGQCFWFLLWKTTDMPKGFAPASASTSFQRRWLSKNWKLCKVFHIGQSQPQQPHLWAAQNVTEISTCWEGSWLHFCLKAHRYLIKDLFHKVLTVLRHHCGNCRMVLYFSKSSDLTLHLLAKDAL